MLQNFSALFVVMNSADIPDDETLYRRFLTGEQTAYDQLMIRHGDNLTFYLYGYLHDWQDAEDQMIEAFARIMVKKPRISDGSFKAYLYKTGRNLAYRYHSKTHKAAEFSFEEYDIDIETDELTEKLLISEEQRKILRLCLERIDPELKEALWLVYFEDMSYKAAAHIMGVNEKKIDHLLSKGKKVMREELKKEGITDANE